MWHHLHLLLLFRLHVKVSIKVVTQVVFGKFSNSFDAIFSFYSFRVTHKNHWISFNRVWRYPNLLVLFILNVKISNIKLVKLFFSYLLVFLSLIYVYFWRCFLCDRSFKWVWHVPNFVFFFRLYISKLTFILEIFKYI